MALNEQLDFDKVQAKPTLHAGLGLFAKISFDPGDLIWSEKPLVSTGDLNFTEMNKCFKQSGIFKNNIQYISAFANSSEDVRMRLLRRFSPPLEICEESYMWKHVKAAAEMSSESLYRMHSFETLRDVCLLFMANQYPSSVNDRGLIFELGSLFNHHCNANAHYKFDADTGTGNWIALRPIVPGDEIAISYIYPHYPTFWRRHQLRHRYFFNCKCSKCAEPDMNRMIPCQACNPSSSVFDVSTEIVPITEGFFVKNWHTSILDKQLDGGVGYWKCRKCGIERVATGVPLLVEKQLCVDVQMLMKTWVNSSLQEIMQIRDIALRLLGPKHFCYIYATQSACKALIREKTTDFKTLLRDVQTMVDWVEEREAGFSGFHLEGFILAVVEYCAENNAEIDSCWTLMKLTRPWTYLFKEKEASKKTNILLGKLRTQGSIY